MGRWIVKCVLWSAVCWLVGFVWFGSQLPLHPQEDKTRTDAIVVLTGGQYRLEHAFQLYNEGLASRLFISGVGKGVQLDDLLQQMAPLDFDTQDTRWRQGIVLGHQAVNTVENAYETREWASKNAIGSLRLVTSNYHMPRSMLLFNSAFAEAGMHVMVIPDAVVGKSEDSYALFFQRRFVNYVYAEYHKWLYSLALIWTGQMV